MPNVFSKIINREIPAYIIGETERYVAFLDVNPLAMGHTLVVPKQEIDDFFDLDDEILSNLMLYAKHVAKAIKQAIDCKKVGMAVIGLEVPHAHVHLVPIHTISDISFDKAKLHPDKQSLEATCQKIKDHLKY